MLQRATTCTRPAEQEWRADSFSVRVTDPFGASVLHTVNVACRSQADAPALTANDLTVAVPRISTLTGTRGIRCDPWRSVCRQHHGRARDLAPLSRILMGLKASPSASAACPRVQRYPPAPCRATGPTSCSPLNSPV